MKPFLQPLLIAVIVLMLCAGCTQVPKAAPASPTETVSATLTPEPVTPSGKLIYLSNNTLFQMEVADRTTVPLDTASDYLQAPATGQYLNISPDGKTLFFSGYDPLIGCSTFRPVYVCIETGPNGFFTLDLASGAVNLIRPYTISNISLSPDGSRFAFTVLEFDTTDYQVHLKLSPADGGVPVVLTSGHVVDTFPSWSPDGKWIAFLRTPSPNPDAPECTPEPTVFDTCTSPLPSLYIIHPDGSGLTKLLESVRLFRSLYNQPTWSSDSQTLAVVSGNPDAQVTLVDITEGTSK